jgi:hypothetical protein
MPGGTEVLCLFICLAAQLQDVGVTRHGFDIGIVPKFPQSLSKSFQLFRAELLTRKPEHRVFGPGLLQL